MKKFIKESKYFLIIIVFVFLLFKIKLPYYIDGPGGLININDRYTIEDSYEAKGSFNMTYVSEYKASIPFYLFAKINDDYDIYKKRDVIPTNETEKDNDYRGKITLKEGSDNAIINAYSKANKQYIIKSQKIVIIYIDEEAKTDLKVGDELISVDNIKVSTRQEVKKIIQNHNIGDKIIFKVKTRNNKLVDRYGYVKKGKIIGVLFSYDREIETNPKIKVKTEADEYGPSGGLMTTLAIYNKLTKKDITKGYIIAGTGTIEEDGSVGEIDGIKYKLKGAIKNKANIFLAPSGSNYKEAIKEKKKHHYKIKIVKVKNLDDAINYLNKIKEK